MNREYLVEGPIKPELLNNYLSLLSGSKETGGHSIFIGQVREDTIGEKQVRAIEYSAYEAMVAEEAERIKSLTKAAFEDVYNIEIVHSTGIVPAGEMSLFVLVTAGHRDQAIRACRHVVEMIKVSYPVWKKEIFEDDTTRWKENQ